MVSVPFSPSNTTFRTLSGNDAVVSITIYYLVGNIFLTELKNLKNLFGMTFLELSP